MLLDRNTPQFSQNFHELSFGGEANEIEVYLMQLDDRAINYQSHPPHLELNQGEIGDIPCGTCRQKYPRHIRATQPIDLKYGQDTDCTSEPVDIAPPTHATAAPENNRQQALAELRSIHLNNIRRNLEHRLQVAREKGDENLICLLSAELEQIG